MSWTENKVEVKFEGRVVETSILFLIVDSGKVTIELLKSKIENFECDLLEDNIFCEKTSV